MAATATIVRPTTDRDLVLADVVAAATPVPAWLLQTILMVIVALVSVASFVVGYRVG